MGTSNSSRQQRQGASPLWIVAAMALAVVCVAKSCTIRDYRHVIYMMEAGAQSSDKAYRDSLRCRELELIGDPARDSHTQDARHPRFWEDYRNGSWRRWR